MLILDMRTTFFTCHCVLVSQADFQIPHCMGSDAKRIPELFPALAQHYRKNRKGEKLVFVLKGEKNSA